MRITYNAVAILLFFMFQPFILYVFLEYGRDTPMYMEMARGVGSQYLEPFWYLIYSAIDNLANVPMVKFYFMYCLFLLGSYLFVNRALQLSWGWLSKITILMLVWSVQLSAVGGAFRQGIAMVFFSLFLINPKVKFHFLSMLTHWSGCIYFLYWRRGAYLIFIVLALLAISVFVYFSGIIGADISLIGRLAFYLSNPFETDLSIAYGVMANKGLVFVLFLLNRNVLKRSELGIRPVLYYTFMLVPVLQIFVFLITGSQQILHRFGMILDPFVVVFFVLIAARGTLSFKLVVLFLVLLKFLSRTILVFEV